MERESGWEGGRRTTFWVEMEKEAAPKRGKDDVVPWWTGGGRAQAAVGLSPPSPRRAAAP
jgi:hypothetical protein